MALELETRVRNSSEKDKNSRYQFGGHSIAHYVIEESNFILYNQDLSKPMSTFFAGIDIQTEYYKFDHCKIVIILSNINVPSWILKMVGSYHSGRTLKLRQQQLMSSTEQMPGGTGAGTPLGLLCLWFVVCGLW